MLFIQGARDAFGSPAELRKVFERLRLNATLFEIETGDHSFKVLKSIQLSQDEVHEAIMDEVARWLVLQAARL
jgi:predicted alpha/beta-hydrolase family hydrolase